jgi:leucyl aminopeptidase
MSMKAVVRNGDPWAGQDAVVTVTSEEGLSALTGRWPALEAAVQQGYSAEAGDLLVLYPGTPRRLVVVGLGKAREITARTVREAVAAGVERAVARSVSHVGVALPEDVAFGDAAWLGAHDGAYRFHRYRRPPEGWPDAVTVTVGGPQPAGWTDAAAGMTWTVRDWVNLGSNDKPPETLAGLMRQALPEAVTTEALTVERLKAMGAGGILAVGQGSAHPPVMLVARYQGRPGDARWLALVGKGITFDSGGLSLKTGAGMMTMKHDMAGAAAVMGATGALAAAGAPVNVLAVACLAENMPDGGAQRPGDVIRTLDGTTVEVLNTDAEGRLVLADGVAYCRREGASAIVDMATLTGANMAALGGVRAGYLTRDERLKEAVEQAAVKTGEWVWAMPPDREFRRALDSTVADLKNVAARPLGGMQVGGLFVGTFAGDTPWLHIDIAGVAFQEDDPRPGRPAGATGYGVALLSYLTMIWFGELPASQEP